MSGRRSKRGELRVMSSPPREPPEPPDPLVGVLQRILEELEGIRGALDILIERSNPAGDYERAIAEAEAEPTEGDDPT